MHMLKKIIQYGFVLGTFVLIGCRYSKYDDKFNYVPYQTNMTVKAFNDETYVWENYQFTTNQVKEIKK